MLGALGAVAGAVGGASKGFAPALRDVLGRQQDEEQFEAQRADTQAYRKQALSQDQQRMDQAAASEAARAQDAERARAMERRRMLHERNIDQQRLEIDRMRERRLADGTAGDERADRALNAAEAVAAMQARRPVFSPDEFATYAQYRKALDEYMATEREVWKTFGFNGPEDAAEYMPGGAHLRPSNHQRPSPISQLRSMKQESGLSLPELGRQYGSMYGTYLGPGGG